MVNFLFYLFVWNMETQNNLSTLLHTQVLKLFLAVASVLKWKFQFNLIPFRSLFIEHSFKRLWEGFPKFSSVVIFGLFVDFQTFKWIWETHFLTYLEVIGFVWKISYKTNADLISKHHFLSYKNVAKLSWS